MSNSSYRGILLDGQAVEITVTGRKISSVTPIPVAPGLPRLLPALVDLQQNGALGYAFNLLTEQNLDALRTLARHLLKNGVGRILATLTTCPYETLATASAALKTLLDANADLNSLFAGIFHEGVFISPKAGWRGGHAPEFIRPPDWDCLQRLNELSGYRIKMVNVAPEEAGGLEFISAAAKAGLIVAIGHCCPDTDTIRKAADCGATIVTHFANGAAPEIHRFKNPFWGFLDEDRLTLGLVGDGFHLLPEIVRVALKVKGPKKCFVVSDANMHSGLAPGFYQRVGGLGCIIEPNGFVHLPDAQILAGAWFQNNRGVEFLVNRVGLPFEDAWKLCSTTPARIASIDLPDLSPNSEATFVQAKFQNQKLSIEKMLFLGEEF